MVGHVVEVYDLVALGCYVRWFRVHSLATREFLIYALRIVDPFKSFSYRRIVITQSSMYIARDLLLRTRNDFVSRSVVVHIMGIPTSDHRTCWLVENVYHGYKRPRANSHHQELSVT